MNNIVKMHNVEQNKSDESKKPSHVRKLNFGRSILTLDVVTQFQGQKDGVLLIDKDVANIPCTKKGDFVREWIKAHNIRISDSDEASSDTESIKTSPVFNNPRKRTRQKSCLNDNVIQNGKDFKFSVESNKRIKMDGNDRKENIRKNLFNSQSVTIPFKPTDATVSPVLVRNSYSYKRRRRKPEEKRSERKAFDRIENKSVETNATSPLICTKTYRAKESPKLDRNFSSYEQKRRKQRRKNPVICDKTKNSCVDVNMNSMGSSNSVATKHFERKWEMLCEQKRSMLVKRLEKSFKNNCSKSTSSKDLKISEDSMGSRSSASQTRLSIEDSSKDEKDTVKIEIEVSNKDDNSDEDILRINNDTDKDSSDHIEDVDTQDAVPVTSNRGLTHDLALALTTKSTSICSQTSNKDSDETFFSKAEQFRCKSSDARSSQKISQISTQVGDIIDNRSNQTETIVSTETLPRKTYADASIRLTLLDSGKKRKKPKKGSLTKKLQSTISRQVSFVRIWRHRLKQTTKQGTALRCVTICVQACVTRFGRQFLEGVAIQDPFNLLSQKEGINSVKLIKIMIIPDIVGRIEMKSDGLIQIYPPWEILDDKDLMLHVTYIRVVPDNERDVERCKVNLNQFKRSVVKEFDCPCIDANKMIQTCKDRFNKPNVIEQLFTQF